MPHSRCIGQVHIEIINTKTVDRFIAALTLLQEAEQDLPWRDDLKEAEGHLIYVLQNMRAKNARNT